MLLTDWKDNLADLFDVEKEGWHIEASRNATVSSPTI